MIKKILKVIKYILLIIIVLSISTIYIDYQRLNHGKEPVFCIKEYHEKNKTITYSGFFYKVIREIKMYEKENILESNEIKFKILNKEIDIPTEKQEKLSFTLLNQKEKVCNEESILYFANKSIKVYTYCISTIKIKNQNQKKSIELIDYIKNNEQIIDDIIEKFNYVGLAEDKEIEVYKTTDDKFTNNKLVIYKCNKEDINDIYIAPVDTQVKDDFCTFKDDDWKFIWEIEEQPYTDNKAFKPDTFFEDDNNYYVLTKTTKDRIYIKTPKVRGRKATKELMVDALNEGKITIDELKNKGLNFTTKTKDKENNNQKEN